MLPTIYDGASIYEDADKGEVRVLLRNNANANIVGELRLSWDDARHVAGLLAHIFNEETPF